MSVGIGFYVDFDGRLGKLDVRWVSERDNSCYESESKMKSGISLVMMFVLLVGSVGMGIGCNSESPTETESSTPTETAEEIQKKKERDEKIREAGELILLATHGMTGTSDEIAEIIKDASKTGDTSKSIMIPIILPGYDSAEKKLDEAERKLKQAERISEGSDLFEMEDAIEEIRSRISELRTNAQQYVDTVNGRS